VIGGVFLKLEIFQFLEKSIEHMDNNIEFINTSSDALKKFFNDIFLNCDFFINTTARIKSEDSIREKLLRNNYYYKYPNHKVAIENLPDLIGIRVECRFIDDEQKIYDEISKNFTIQLEDGYFGFSDLIGYRLTGLKRFDIVIVYLAEKKEYLIKRVIGLPGETVEYRNNQLYINGEPVEEPFLDESYTSTYPGSFTGDFKTEKLGDDEYFCMGDNRPHSSDSRYYGAFHKSDIVSKGVFVVYPFKGFGVYTW